MKNIKFYFTLLLFLFTSLIFSQNRTEFFGQALEGNVMVGKAKGIKSVLFETKSISFDTAGYFIFGFDRDAKGDFSLTVNFTDKKREKYYFTIDKEKYNVQRLSGISKALVNPPKKFRKRISEETKIITSQKKKIVNTKTAYFADGFRYPVDSVEITSVFGSGRVLNGQKKNPHNGLDFSAPSGYPVKAAGDGIVILAEENFYYNGTFVMIDHGFGLVSNYLHMSKLHIKRGDIVKKGDLIGKVGSTGRSTGAHLHWGVNLFNKRIDPMCLIKLRIKNEE